MKKIIFILALCTSAVSVKAQFPNKDSAERFANKWVRNSAVDAFTNQRLNTLLIWMMRYTDSTGIKKMEVDGTTLRIITVGKDTFSVTLPGGDGGSGNTNSNIGSGFRLAVPNTNNIKTIFAGLNLLLDSSSNTNALTFKMDTAGISAYYLRIKDSVSKYVTPARLSDSIASARASMIGYITERGDTIYAQRASTLEFQYFTRKANLSSTGDTIYFAGDSYVAGQGSSTGRSFAAEIPPMFGKIMGNLGVGGTGAKVASMSLNQTLAGANNYSAVLGWFGYNDLRRSGYNAKTLRKIYNAWMSILASSYLSENAIPASSASTTGTWTAQDIGVALGGKSTKMGGTARYAQSTGATMSWTFTGTNLVISTVAYDGVGVTGGKIKVALDGTPIDTIDLNGQTDFISDGVSNNAQMVYAKVYWDLAATSHTVVLTTLDNNTVYVDYLGVLNGVTNTPPVFVSLIPKMKQTSYALGSGTTPPTNLATDAVFNSGDSVILLAYNQFASRKYAVVLVKPNTYFNPEDATQMDADNVHPSDTGYTQIVKSVASQITPSSSNFIATKNGAAYIKLSQDERILFGNATPDPAKDIFSLTYESAIPRFNLFNPAAPVGKRGFRLYKDAAGVTTLGEYDLNPNKEGDAFKFYMGTDRLDSISAGRVKVRGKDIQGDSAFSLVNLDNKSLDTTAYKPLVIDASNGKVFKSYWQTVTGGAPSLTSNYIGYGISSVLSGSSAFQYDGTAVQQENSSAVNRIVSTTAVGSTSGGSLRLFAKATPTAADQILANIEAGTMDGGTTENITAAIRAYSGAAHTPGSSEQTGWKFYTTVSNTVAQAMVLTPSARLGIGVSVPVASLSLRANSSTVPALGFTRSGATVTAIPIDGGFEPDANGKLFYSIASGAGNRRQLALTDSVGAVPTGRIMVGNNDNYTVADIFPIATVTTTGTQTLPGTAKMITYKADATGGNITITLSANHVGQVANIIKTNTSNTVTIAAASGSLLYGITSLSTQGEGEKYQWDGTNWLALP